MSHDYLVALACYFSGSYMAFSRNLHFKPLKIGRVTRFHARSLISTFVWQIITFVVLYFVTSNGNLALPLSIILGYLPRVHRKNRLRKRSEERRKSWPLVVDQLASATSSGVAPHHALIQMVNRGPLPLKEDFIAFSKSFAVEGSLERGLDAFVASAKANSLNGGDRTAQRLRSTMLVVRDCGGEEVGPILRNLGNHLRQRERTFNEIAIKQEWIKNGAVLASLSPWLLLVILSFHSQTVAAYSNTGGRVVLASGLVLTFIAYRWITHISQSISASRVS